MLHRLIGNFNWLLNVFPWQQAPSKEETVLTSVAATQEVATQELGPQPSTSIPQQIIMTSQGQVLTQAQPSQGILMTSQVGGV